MKHPESQDRDGTDKTVIYDFGANNGDNIEYYLKKSDIVVAVEANPVLCQEIRRRFESEIQQRKLVLENCVLTVGDQASEVPFFIHKTKDVLSQLHPPRANLAEFEQVILPCKSVTQLVKNYGFPHYVKIDIEGFDHAILRALLDAQIRPKYLSAEAHRIEIFLLLTSLGAYNSFKLVNGKTVDTDYRDHWIETNEGKESYSFKFHSAGPFGEDVKGDWIDSAELFRRLRSEGLGWKDIHVRKDDPQSHETAFTIPWQLESWIYRLRWFNHKVFRKIRRTLDHQ